jgi:Rrf2 family transcriptional regulator, cysteine metabolism repressor
MEPVGTSDVRRRRVEFPPRMRISAKVTYACLALIDIAQSETDGFPRRVREIAQAQGIPRKYLPKILIHLKAAGLVESARGSGGGYQLALSPAEISLSQVIVAMDGQHSPLKRGNSTAARNLSEALSQIQSAYHELLATVTIAQLARQPSPQDWVI